MNEYNVENITNTVLVVLKDGRIKPSIDLNLDDFRGIYEKWEYAGTFDPIGQFGAWVVNTISGALDYLYSRIRDAISSAASSIISGVGNLLNTVISPLKSAISYVQSVIDTIRSNISNIYSLVSTIPDRLRDAAFSILNSIKDLGNAIPKLIDNVLSRIGNVITLIQDFGKSLQDAIGAVVSRISDLTKVISSTISTLYNQISALVSTISDKIGLVVNSVKDLTTKITDTISLLQRSISNTIDSISNTLKGVLENVNATLKSLQGALQSFTNPLVTISSLLSQTLTNLGGIISSAWDTFRKIVIDPIWTVINSFIQFIVNEIPQIPTRIWNGLLQLGDSIRKILIDPVINLLKSIFIDPIVKGLETVWYVFSEAQKYIPNIFNPRFWMVGVISPVVSGIPTIVPSIVSAISSSVATAMATITTLLVRLYNAIKSFIGTVIDSVMSTFFTTTLYFDIISRAEKKMQKDLLDNLKGATDVLFSFVRSPMFMEFVRTFATWMCLFEMFSLIKNVEISLTPILAKIGARISPEAFVKYLKKTLQVIFKEALKTVIFTTSFWLFEPFKYLLNPWFRNILPIEIPTLHEFIEITRRYMPDNRYEVGTPTPIEGVTYSKIREHLLEVVSKRGYPPWLDPIVTEGYDKFYFTVTDRFNVQRVIPSALIYAVPPPSDVVRMMLRDMIQNLDDFGRIMSMHGYHPDISALYFMLHFRYPSAERLFEFACRVASGIVWLDRNEPGAREYFDYIQDEIRSFTKWKLGFEPRTPKELADDIEKSYPLRNLENLTQIATNRVAKAFSPLGRYFKWHDLFPMAWLKGFTSDQMIAMELSADIPMRIDARWMYKWCVINEEELVRIVIARGMHPKWVEKIAIAEMMNALAEERTVVRTGMMNAFKEGFITEDKLRSQMQLLDTVRLLDRDVPIRFLDGEVKLLVLRSKYDRAMDILLTTQKSMFTAFAENIVDYDELVNVLRTVTDKVNASLNLKLHFDKDYYDLIFESLKVRKSYETISRIRSWARYVIREMMNRLRAGYLLPTDVENAIEMLKNHARLTDQDVEYFKDVAKLMHSEFRRKVTVDSVLRKLSKGLITKDEALKLLTENGIDSELADALIEVNAKTYTLSIAQYLSYANIIDIPTEYIERKLELLGVPPDERSLILAVFNVKPIKSERDALVKRYLDEFENGYVDEKTVKDNLDKLGVLPKAIDILIEMKKVEKSMNAKKILVDAVLSRLRRGVIKLEDAINELKKYIVDESLIYALIEKYVRTYTFSPDKMISIAEYVPVNIEWIVEKARMYGYPEEEVKLIPAYAVAREISEEMKRLANELGSAFAEGIITEDEYRKALDELATLGGQAKSKFGVDWIVLSPEERYVLVQIYKTRAIRKLYSKSQ